MAEGRSIRGFLRKHRKQRDDLNASDPRGSASASATSSFASQSGDLDVAMEGPLKKRVAKMPVMHDRYCVATWELDADERKCAMLRSYKSRKAYDAHPERPSSVHQLKCLSDWDGKTGFHRYQHAFTMETRDQKLFQCVAPSAADKDKWLELLAVQSAFRSGRDMRVSSVGSLVPLRRTQSVESTAEPPAAVRKESADSDGLFRTTSGASTNSPDGDKDEPADWGLYGGEHKATHELQDDDARPVLLDTELLDAKTLATDAYLFEDGRASRFGAVVVQAAAASDDDDDADFVDEQFAAREAHEQQQQSMRRRAQKLESNRDLYAEMAAARLAGMRKDARHPRKSLSHSRPSDDSDEEEEQDEDQLTFESETKESAAELDDVHQRHSSRSHRSSTSRKKSFVSSSDNTNSVVGGYVSGDDEEEEEVEEVAAPAEVAEAELDEVEELRQLKKQHRAERRAKKRLMKEKEEEEQAALQAAELARAHREEQRAREEAKVREEQEKRDKKERREMKEKLKREKAKQRQAEAELRKLVELKQAEEERRERERKEKKDKKEKKKTKKKGKYTSPAERIQKKEERAAERAAESAAAAVTEPEVSNALVVVEKTVEPEPAPQLSADPTPALSSVPSSIPSSVLTEVTQTEQVATPAPVPVAPIAAPAPVSVPAPTPVAAPVGGAAAPAQTMPMPMYQVVPPPFVPMYPPGPQGMPAYGLAATFGAYPPQLYPTPYNYGMPVGPQPTYMRPNMGFMAGLSAMGSFGKAAGPESAPSSQDYAEPMIGPQLPTAEDRAAASSAGASAPPPPPPSADKTSAKLTNLPELPDVVEF